MEESGMLLESYLDYDHDYSLNYSCMMQGPIIITY